MEVWGKYCKTAIEYKKWYDSILWLPYKDSHHIDDIQDMCFDEFGGMHYNTITECLICCKEHFETEDVLSPRKSSLLARFVNRYMPCTKRCNSYLKALNSMDDIDYKPYKVSDIYAARYINYNGLSLYAISLVMLNLYKDKYKSIANFII